MQDSTATEAAGHENTFFPLTMGGPELLQATLNPRKFDGKAAAVIGYVILIRKTPTGGTFLRLAVNSPTEAVLDIITTVPPGEGSYLSIAKELKVLGYLRNSEYISKSVGPEYIGDSPIVLQSVCHNIPNTSIAIGDPRLSGYCQDWAKGFMPEDLR